MIYDFVEVGTCDFDTLIEKATDDDIGLSIEPIRVYLDRLPNKKNVVKICAALVAEKDYTLFQKINAYYVKEETINQYNLGQWLKGCNTVGKPHDFHTRYFWNAGIWHNSTEEERKSFPTTNLLEKGLVTVESVDCLTYSQLVEKYGIVYIKVLKTDTEGYDAFILEDVINYHVLNNTVNLLPREIHFEDNSHSDKDQMVKCKNLMRKVGYKINDTHTAENSDSFAILEL